MSHNKQSLNQLLPYGLLVTRRYLLASGMNSHTLDNAMKSGKLVALARGVYMRAGVPVDWRGVMTSLNLMSADQVVYIGGITAIEHSGLGHYIQNSSKLDIYSGTTQPSWLARLKSSADLVWHNTSRLWVNAIDISDKNLNPIQWREDLPPYFVASAEQACFEFLATVPKTISFEYADLLFQGLTSLSPHKLDLLLRNCNSIKAKRLFFWFAKRHGFQWSKKINHQEYDLGSGKRLIASNGRLDKTFLITVPGSI